MRAVVAHQHCGWCWIRRRKYIGFHNSARRGSETRTANNSEAALAVHQVAAERGLPDTWNRREVARIECWVHRTDSERTLECPRGRDICRANKVGGNRGGGGIEVIIGGDDELVAIDVHPADLFTIRAAWVDLVDAAFECITWSLELRGACAKCRNTDLGHGLRPFVTDEEQRIIRRVVGDGAIGVGAPLRITIRHPRHTNVLHGGQRKVALIDEVALL